MFSTSLFYQVLIITKKIYFFPVASYDTNSTKLDDLKTSKTLKLIQKQKVYSFSLPLCKGVIYNR